MRKLIFLPFLLLASCASPEEMAARGIGHAISLGSTITFDTNGYYSKRTQPPQKICEVRVSHSITKLVPCK